MSYYRVLPGTKEAALLKEAFYGKRKWYVEEVKNEIEQLLGVPLRNNLYLTEKQLLLLHLPKGKKVQFERGKKGNYYRAKEGSPLNREYLELCKKHGLRDYSLTDFSLESGVFAATGGRGGNTYYCFNDDYYLETEMETLNEKLPWLIAVRDHDFFAAQDNHERRKLQKAN